MGAREGRKHAEGQAVSRTSATLITPLPIAAVRVMKRLCRDLEGLSAWPVGGTLWAEWWEHGCRWICEQLGWRRGGSRGWKGHPKLAQGWPGRGLFPLSLGLGTFVSGAHRVMCWGGRDDGAGEGRSGQQVVKYSHGRRVRGGVGTVCV